MGAVEPLVRTRAAHRRTAFAWAAGGFVAGCAAAPSWGAVFLAACSVLALGAAIVGTRWRPAGWGALAAAFAAAGWGWTQLGLADVARLEDVTRELSEAKSVPIEARVVSAVAASATGASFEGIILSAGGRPTPAWNLRLHLPGNVRPQPGSTVVGVALMGRPEGAMAAAAKTFRARDIRLSAYLSSPRITPGEPGGIARFRTVVLDTFDAAWPSPVRGVMAGILLGDSSRLEKSTLADFRTSGLSHMLVASGSNVAIVLMVLGVLCRRLPGWTGAGIAAGGGVLFALLAGGGAPVARAAAMGAIAAGILAGGARVRTGNVLLATLVAFCSADPLAAAWDPSLRLSFCATAGALWLSKPLESWLGWVPRAWALREGTAVSLAAALSTLPISAADFGSVSLAAIPANLLAGWAVAPAMALGTLTAALSWWPWMRDVAGLLGWVAANWIAQVAHVGAAWPWATVTAPTWVGWMAAGASVALAIRGNEKSPEKPGTQKIKKA